MWGVYVGGFYFAWDADPGIVDMVTVLCTELSFVLKKKKYSFNKCIIFVHRLWGLCLFFHIGRKRSMSNQIPSCCSEKLVWLLDENNGNANGCFGLLKFV